MVRSARSLRPEGGRKKGAASSLGNIGEKRRKEGREEGWMDGWFVVTVGRMGRFPFTVSALQSERVGRECRRGEETWHVGSADGARTESFCYIHTYIHTYRHLAG